MQCIKNKISDLEILTSKKDIQVLCVTEHWCHANEIEQIAIPNFNLAANFCRSKKTRGGSCIFIKDKIPFKSLGIKSEESIFEASAIKLIDQNVVIFCVYRPPDGDLDVFLRHLDNALRAISSPQIIVCGDLNVNSLSDSPAKHNLFDTLSLYGLKSLISCPTRTTGHSATAIDYMLTNIPLSNKPSVSVEDLGISDHHGIFFQAQLSSLHTPKHTSNVKIWTRPLSAPNLDKFKDTLQTSTKTQNFSFESFYSHFTSLHEQHFPLKRVAFHKSKNDWITPGIRVSSDHLRQLHRVAKDANNNILSAHYRHFKRVLRKTIVKAKILQNDNNIKKSPNISKAIWDMVKTETNQRDEPLSKITKIVNENGQPFKNISEQAEFINTYFLSLAPLLAEKIPAGPYMEPPKTAHTFSLTPTTKKEVLEHIKKMKSKSTTDLNGISAKVLKACANEIVDDLVQLINESFKTGIFPNELKIAKVIPIYKKKGDPTSVKNQRPISILPIFSKIFESIVKSQLTSYLIENQLINPSQHGFLPKRNTESAILEFTDTIMQALDSGHPVSALFLDLLKAFDTVDHQILLVKLASKGVSDQALKWFQSYLHNRKQAVAVTSLDLPTNTLQTTLSSFQTITSGVPQGSVLGPLLFIIYVDDLPSRHPPDTKNVVFADDHNIVNHDKTPFLLQGRAQASLDNTVAFFQENKLSVNPTKTTAMNFALRGQRDIPSLFLDNHPINFEPSSKFLGVRIDQHLNWQRHTQELRAKLYSICFTQRIICNSCSPNVALMTYHAYFHSHLSYGIMFWGSLKQNLMSIFTVQKKCLRIMGKIPPRSSCRPLFNEYHILPAPCVFIQKTAMYIKSNPSLFNSVSDHHDHNTRHGGNLQVAAHATTARSRSIFVLGVKIYNALPESVTAESEIKNFKKALNTYLHDKCFYSLEEFLCQ